MGLKGQRLTLLSPRTGKGVYLAMGEGKTVGVGDNLQEDVHVVKNGSESRVLAIVLCDLRAEGAQRGRVVDACTRLPSAAAASRWEVEGRSSVGLAPQRPPAGAYLLCKPDPAGLGDPLPGMDARVNPDGRTVAAPSAELEEKSVEMIPPPQRAVRPRPEATCPLGISS